MASAIGLAEVPRGGGCESLVLAKQAVAMELTEACAFDARKPKAT
jgi:hypothetical protein